MDRALPTTPPVFADVADVVDRLADTGYLADAGIQVIPCTTTTSTQLYPATDDFGDLGAPVNNWQPAILTGQEGQAVLSRIQAMSTVTIS